MTAGYIRTLCSPAVIIANLGSDALQNVIGMHRCPTSVRAARLPSTSPTSVGTRCRTSLVCTTVRHLYVLHVWCHYRWLYSYALLVCLQHRRPMFIRVAEPRWYAPQSHIFISSASAAITTGYIRMRCSSAVNIAELRSYALQNLVCMCRCPTFVCAAPPPSTSLTYIRTQCRTSLEFTTVLHLYALLVCRQHRRPPFVRVGEPRWYAPLSYIRMRCSSAVYIADLRSYALQNLVGMYRCPTFVHAARLPSTSLTYVRTYCRTPLVHTAVRHLYVLRVCRHDHWLHSYAPLACRHHC